MPQEDLQKRMDSSGFPKITPPDNDKGKSKTVKPKTPTKTPPQRPELN